MVGEDLAPYIESVDALDISKIEEIIHASDAQGMRVMITKFAQFSHDEERDYFVRDYAPKSTQLVPQDRNEKRNFYTALGRRLVAEWKTDPSNRELRNRVLLYLDCTTTELFFADINANSLASFGYSIDDEGRVNGIDPQYQYSIEAMASANGMNLDLLSEKAGGITIDILKRAKLNLQLSEAEAAFIDQFIIDDRETERAKQRKVDSLRLSEETRRYYLDSGLELDDFMMLWGINKDFATTTHILYNMACTHESRMKMLEAAVEMTGQDSSTESEVYRGRAQILNLPYSLPSGEEITQRNSGILEEVQEVMKYEQITRRRVQPKAIILTKKLGTTQRAMNITYPTENGKVANVQIMGAYSPEAQLGATLGHEFTHELHAWLIINKDGLESWNKTNEGIKELFAQLVDRSFQAVYKNRAVSFGGWHDSFYPPLLDWFPFPFGYGQQRLLEMIAQHDGPMSDEQLLAMEETITREMESMNVVQDSERILDLRPLRRAPYNVLNPRDGIVYKIKDINSVGQETEEVPLQADQPPTPQTKVTAQSLMEQKWGPRWIMNSEAYKVVVAAMVQSSEYENTEQVIRLMLDLITRDNEVTQILDSYGIKLL